LVVECRIFNEPSDLLSVVRHMWHYLFSDYIARFTFSGCLMELYM